MPVARDKAVAMTDLQYVAVAVAPPRSHDDAVANRPHRRAIVGRIVGALVHPDAAEDRMLAATEHARDAPEFERCAQERRTHRLPRLIEEPAAYRRAVEVHGADRIARQLERRRNHAADLHRTRRGHRTLGDD